MSNSIQIRAKIDGPGITAASLSWPVLREFMDAFTMALAAMPHGPKPGDVVFESVAEGSAIPTARVPLDALPAVEVLADGPTAAWTRDQRRGAEPLYHFAREHSATLSLGGETLRLVTIPTSAREWTLHERGELRARVHMVGGRRRRVHLDVFDEGIVVCDGELSLVKRLAALLDDDVFVEGEIRRDAATGALLHVEIEAFRPCPRRRTAREVLAELDAKLAEKMRGFDVAGFMRSEREA